MCLSTQDSATTYDIRRQEFLSIKDEKIAQRQSGEPNANTLVANTNRSHLGQSSGLHVPTRSFTSVILICAKLRQRVHSHSVKIRVFSYSLENSVYSPFSGIITSRPSGRLTPTRSSPVEDYCESDSEPLPISLVCERVCSCVHSRDRHAKSKGSAQARPQTAPNYAPTPLPQARAKSAQKKRHRKKRKERERPIRAVLCDRIQ